MEWLNDMNSLISLITGLFGLIAAGISTFFAVKQFIKNLKTKNLGQLWNSIMEIADSAMKEAEKCDLKGADKKDKAISIIKESCKTAGINIDAFMDQLDAYIDSTIDFVNKMSNK